MKKDFLFACLLSLAFTSVIGQQYDPVADSKAVVIQGNARFTVLTEGLIRMEYSAEGKFIDQASLTFVNRNLPVPAYKVSHSDGWIVISTQVLTLKYKENSGSFNRQNLEVSYDDGQRKFNWYPGIKDKRNLKGTTRTLDGALGQYSFMKLKKLPIEPGMLSRSGWTLIDDSERPLFDNSDWPWVEERRTARSQTALNPRRGGDLGGLDWYFFGYGDHYKQALFDFIQTAGRISMPPEFAFGIWYSRYWNYTEQEMKDIVNDYNKNNIPLDVLVVDMDWHLTENSSPEIFNRYHPKPNGWTGFTWEKKYFPDYHEFLKWIHDNKLQTCLNIHPAAGVQAHEEAYPAFARAMGNDTSIHAPIPFDITDKKFAKNYFDILLHPYEKAGVDFWWLDWQQWGNTKLKGVNPTFYLNYVHYSDMQREGKRPLIFHRWGGLGNHRYEIGFSGDCIIDWRSLAYQPSFTATASNVGFGYWSHDIGGHMNPVSLKSKQDPELFTRWVQWGAFSPVFRTHATKDPTIERRIWKYPAPYFEAMRKAMQWRYSLLPYIYTYARFAYDSGISLVRPMYYEYPELDKAYHLEHQYYFGNNMLVAPIYKSMGEKETGAQSVWLPPGNWYDYRTNELLQGDKSVSLNYSLDEIPVFIKAGSIIPSQPPKLRITGSVMDTLILTVYPDKEAGFRLYEDDGSTESYKKNVCSFTNFSYKQTPSGFMVKIEPDGKPFTGKVARRSYEVQIVDAIKAADVFVDGKKSAENEGWNYDSNKKILTIRTGRVNINDQVIIEVKK